MRKMKKSGVEWIGDIPENWNVGKTLFALSMPITDGPHETPELLEEGIPFVSAEAVSCGNGKIDFEHIRGFISQEYYEECCKKYTPQINDIYMIKSGATTGKVALVDTDEIFTIWSPLAVFRCDDKKCFYKYLFYVLQSDYYQKQVENKWSFGTQQNIGMRTLEKLLICYPPVNEQAKIAHYLDKKCAEIDALIDAKEKTNALLKEQRQSIIYEAVTKGLNPNVPMKDSGIEWIGKIPESWDVKKIKYCTKLDQNKLAENTDPDYEFKYIDISSVTEVGGIDETIEVTFSKSPSRARMIVKNGDTIISTVRTYLKAIAFIEDASDLICSTGFCVVSPVERIINPKFCYYALQSDYFVQNVVSNSVGVSYPAISSVDIGNMKLCIPTLEEQEKIAKYLDAKCSEFNSLIESNNIIVEKLKEYRKSLIIEAVTGKVEV